MNASLQTLVLHIYFYKYHSSILIKPVNRFSSNTHISGKKELNNYLKNVILHNILIKLNMTLHKCGITFYGKNIKLVQLCLFRRETLFSVDRNITQQVNVNISIALSVNLQQTNVQRSFYY